MAAVMAFSGVPARHGRRRSGHGHLAQFTGEPRIARCTEMTAEPVERIAHRQYRSLLYDTGHGFACQISAAYCAMVRSLENFPEPATFRMALRAHASGSAYKSHSRWSASR